jgi:hypothetical protein
VCVCVCVCVYVCVQADSSTSASDALADNRLTGWAKIIPGYSGSEGRLKKTKAVRLLAICKHEH